MIIKVDLADTGQWTDLQDNERVDFGEVNLHQGNAKTFYGGNDATMRMMMLQGGMVSGGPSVALRIDLPTGDAVIVETSLRALVAAVNLFQVKAGMG